MHGLKQDSPARQYSLVYTRVAPRTVNEDQSISGIEFGPDLHTQVLRAMLWQYNYSDLYIACTRAIYTCNAHS